MHTLKPIYPEIDAADIQAARDFLISLRDEAGPGPRPAPVRRKSSEGSRGPVTVHNGITRARGRSASAKATG